MSQKPLLTVAIPTYNGSKTIRTMLDILLPQVTEDVEVIISDNCSTDETPTIVKDYISRYPFIGYSRTENNIGADGNFLRCMRISNGKYVMLLSDDDVLIEGSMTKIIKFLKHNDVELAYLETISFHSGYSGVDSCEKMPGVCDGDYSNLVTDDKKLFFSYIGRNWGFTSSFICKTDRVKSIANPEQYFGTFWMQSYIHILCSDKDDDKLGIIAGPCVAAGNYGILGNYDPYKVEVIEFKRMLDFAIDTAGYDKDQLTESWVWKVCFLLSRSTIKQRSIGVELSSSKDVFNAMKNYPRAWLHLFPALILPNWACKAIMKTVNRVRKRSEEVHINRPT